MSDAIPDDIWNFILNKQQSINKQADERFNKYYQEREKGNRLIEESEKKFFNNQTGIKNHDLEKLDERINRQLENNKFYIYENPAEKEIKTKGGLLLKAVLKNKKLPPAGTGSRYDNYNDVYNLISETNLEYEEKQALMNAVYAVQQEYTKPPEM